MSVLAVLGVWDDMLVAVRTEFIVLCLMFLARVSRSWKKRMETVQSNCMNQEVSGVLFPRYTYIVNILDGV